MWTTLHMNTCNLRDRPFNLKGGRLWFFVSFKKKFSDNTRVRIFIFFCRAKREFFFKNLTLGYMTKTLNQIIFFSSTKIRIFFSATLGIRIFFQKKTITPPFKLNGRSLTQIRADLHLLLMSFPSSDGTSTRLDHGQRSGFAAFD